MNNQITKFEGKIGYACTPVSLPYRTSRGFLLKNFNHEVFLTCVKDNLADLLAILQWNKANQIFMFRIGSDIIPFASHEINEIPWWEIFSLELKEIGGFVKANHMRVSMHPGQYTVLNAVNEDVVNRSIQDLEYHVRFLDTLGLDSSHKCILHVGGIYGDKQAAMRRFQRNFSLLSEHAKKRIVLENDDKSYTISDVLILCNALHIPAVFDNLHHELNPCDMRIHEILASVIHTWQEQDGKMKLHYSQQDGIKKGGAHSKTIDVQTFSTYVSLLAGYEADIMLEVKDKELSALKCINSMMEECSVRIRTSQWSKYKYAVMEKSYKSYKDISKHVNGNTPMGEVYSMIDACLSLPFDKGNFINTAQHVYGYVKNSVTEQEKGNFQRLIEAPELDAKKIKQTLKRLCIKYDISYVMDSYYFIL